MKFGKDFLRLYFPRSSDRNSNKSPTELTGHPIYRSIQLASNNGLPAF